MEHRIEIVTQMNQVWKGQPRTPAAAQFGDHLGEPGPLGIAGRHLPSIVIPGAQNEPEGRAELRQSPVSGNATFRGSSGLPLVTGFGSKPFEKRTQRRLPVSASGVFRQVAALFRMT
jgi:hypothetical protein